MLELSELMVGFPGFAAGPLTTRFGPGIVHLAGPNGAGKTTLLRTVCGELPPRGGTVRVEGRDPYRDHHGRASISLAPARNELPEFLTVREAWQTAAGLRRAPDWDGATVADALALPENLRLAVGSAGQRQKAELLCALAGDPAIVLLDETLAHLDRQTVETVSGWLEEWRATRLIIVAQHAPLPLPHATATFTEEPGGVERRVRIELQER
ncbi:MAG: ATP-binding cassette domain-containing protein [Pseudomonadota bacterium]